MPGSPRWSGCSPGPGPSPLPSQAGGHRGGGPPCRQRPTAAGILADRARRTVGSPAAVRTSWRAPACARRGRGRDGPPRRARPPSSTTAWPPSASPPGRGPGHRPPQATPPRRPPPETLPGPPASCSGSASLGQPGMPAASWRAPGTRAELRRRAAAMRSRPPWHGRGGDPGSRCRSRRRRPGGGLGRRPRRASARAWYLMEP